MFFKALLLSIFLHLFVLCWAEACLPSRTDFSNLGQEPKFRRVAFVEITPPPTLAAEETLGSSPPKAEPKAERGPASLEPLTPESAGAVLPAPTSMREEGPAMVLPSVPSNAEKDQANGQESVVAGPENFTTSDLEGAISSERPSASNPASASATDLKSQPGSNQESEQTSSRESTTTGSREHETVSSKEHASPTAPEGDGATGPVKVFHTDPVYPRVARRRGWEGTVYLSALLDTEGTVLTVEIVKSSGYAVLDEAALEAVAQWRYNWPDGQETLAAEQRITVKISFQLTE